jgi:hypothetical protein
VLHDLFGTFIGPGHYRYVAGACRAFWTAHEGATPGHGRKKTIWESAAACGPCAEPAFEKQVLHISRT